MADKNDNIKEIIDNSKIIQVEVNEEMKNRLSPTLWR